MKTVNKCKEKRREASENSSERFEIFQSVVYDSAGNMSDPLIASKVFANNLRTVRYAAVVIILTSIYWFCTDIARGGELKLTQGAALAAILTQIILSGYMLVLPLVRGRGGIKLVRYSFLAYYICLATTVMILAVTKNIVMLESGMHVPVAGIPLSSYYLFILVLAPLPSMADSIILGVYCVGMMAIPAFAVGHQLYDLKQQAILGVCLIVAYWYVRRVNAALYTSMRRLSVLSYTDPLTETLNRRSLESYFDDVYNENKASTASILLLDIDDFKLYNDNYSHAEGDIVLREICNIATEAISCKDGFLFRYGGEEFVAVLLDTSGDEAVEIGMKIRDSISSAHIARNDIEHGGRITVTVGCSQEKIRESLSHEYIVAADRQLYIGKNDGKNCVVFNGKIYR